MTKDITMTQYEYIKQNIDDFDTLAAILAYTADKVAQVCPQKVSCTIRCKGECPYCPTGWRWVLRSKV